MRGNYRSAIYSAAIDGALHIDPVATVAALKAAHINTFAYLICPDANANPAVSLQQWRDLPAFATEAAKSGIDVFVYLVPPSEAPESAYQPFKWDYPAWADAIGAMAARTPSIKGVMIDDFASNARDGSRHSFTFNPSIVNDMSRRMRRHAPWTQVLPVLYYSDLVGPNALLAEYRDIVDGVIFPFAGSPGGTPPAPNTQDSSDSLAQGLRVGGLVKCLSGSTCAQVVFPTAMAGADDSQSSVNWSTVWKLAQDGRRVLTVWTNDDSTLVRGRAYQLEIYVNGAFAGRAAPPTQGWSKTVVDLTAKTAGKSAVELELRLLRSAQPEGGQLTVQLDSVQLISAGKAVEWQLRGAKTTAGIPVSEASNRPLIYMTYAIPLSSEEGHGASMEYVGAVMQSVAILRKRRLVDGSLVFNLPMPNTQVGGYESKYELVARFYQAWEQDG